MLALVSLQGAVDLLFAFGACGAIWFGWLQLDKREKRRRALRKERQAEYSLARLRRQREWDRAQRYFGAGR